MYREDDVSGALIPQLYFDYLDGGDPSSRLLAIAEQEGADLIVLGTRGLGRIKEILLGSVSHKVVMMAPCPCLIVK